MGIYIPNMEKPEYCRVCHERLKCKQYDGEILHTPDDCPLIDIVTCGECIWKEECTITELWGGRGFCPSGERRTDE